MLLFSCLEADSSGKFMLIQKVLSGCTLRFLIYGELAG